MSYTTGEYAEGWMTITVEGYGTWVRRIFTNYGDTFYFYEPLPIDLSTPGLSVSYHAWTAGDTGTTAAGNVGQGFPAVPKPEIGLLAINPLPVYFLCLALHNYKIWLPPVLEFAKHLIR